jgi:hypothetical protein
MDKAQEHSSTFTVRVLSWGRHGHTNGSGGSVLKWHPPQPHTAFDRVTYIPVKSYLAPSSLTYTPTHETPVNATCTLADSRGRSPSNTPPSLPSPTASMHVTSYEIHSDEPHTHTHTPKAGQSHATRLFEIHSNHPKAAQDPPTRPYTPNPSSLIPRRQQHMPHLRSTQTKTHSIII